MRKRSILNLLLSGNLSGLLPGKLAERVGFKLSVHPYPGNREELRI
jgi:hypothetical protein